MLEEAQKILDYLPLNFKTPQEQEYISHLWKTFYSNYEQKNFQFAFLAYHLLFMSSVYFSLWKIKVHKSDDLKKATIGLRKDDEKFILEATSPFTFSEISESQIFRFFRLVNCEDCEIGEYVKLVKDRNEIAHANGNIFYNSEEQVGDKIEEVLNVLDKIHCKIGLLIKEIFVSFLQESKNPEEREFVDEKDQIEQLLLKKYYMSRVEINLCNNFDISNIGGLEDFYSKFKNIYPGV